jgi:predicted SprT family Zn-dependent metalloprotease
MTNCAGRAWNNLNLVKLSLAFFASESNYLAEFQDTVLHELAHIITRKVYGPLVKPHGREWKYVATMVGAKPERCHAMQLADGFQARKKQSGGLAPCVNCGRMLELGPRQYKEHVIRTSIYQEMKQKNPNFQIPNTGYAHRTCPTN